MEALFSMISCILKAILYSSELGSSTFSPHKKYFGMRENVVGGWGGGIVRDVQGRLVRGDVQGKMSLNL